MHMKKVKEVLITDKSEVRADKKGIAKKRLKLAKTFFVLGMFAVNVSMMVMPVMASQASTDGASIVKNSISVLFNIIAAFVSAYGGIQILWGVFEWGNATNTQDGMMQAMSVRRIGGGLMQTIAPQIVTALIG